MWKCWKNGRFIVLLAVQIIVAFGQVIDIASTARTTACPRTCNDTIYPCECFTDGWIDCPSKGLTTLPRELPSCARSLVIKNNQLRVIERTAFRGLAALLMLEIKNEPIQRLTPGTFSDLTSLMELKVTNTYITNISECTFDGLTNLTSLELRNNRITAIEDRSFFGLHHLETLILKNNSLSSLPKNAFEGLVQLKTLNLFMNNIKTMHAEWFQSKPSLLSIHVARNPWNCTCKQKQDYVYINDTFKPLILCPSPPLNVEINHMCIICETPLQFRGRRLQDISFANYTNCSTPTSSASKMETSNNNNNTRNLLEPTSLDDDNNTSMAYCRILIAQEYTKGTTTETVMKTDPIAVTVTTTSATSGQDNRGTVYVSIAKALNTAVAPPPTKSSGVPTWAIVLIIVIILVIMLVAVLSTLLIIRRTNNKRTSDQPRQGNGTEMQSHNFLNKTYPDEHYATVT